MLWQSLEAGSSNLEASVIELLAFVKTVLWHYKEILNYHIPRNMTKSLFSVMLHFRWWMLTSNATECEIGDFQIQGAVQKHPK